MLHFYEIRNTETQENAHGIARTFSEICKANGWKPHKCQLIWKASTEAAY